MHSSSSRRAQHHPRFDGPPIDPRTPVVDPLDPDGLDPLVLDAVTQAFALSAETRRLYPSVLGEHYGPGVDEYLDVYPARQAGAPILVFLPGGFAGLPMSAADFAGVARGPFAHGITTVVVNYTQAPDATAAETSRQAVAAIAWVYQNADSFGADPGRIVVAGHGAGGRLAACAAVTDWEDEFGLPADIVSGVVTISSRLQRGPSTDWASPGDVVREVGVPVIIAVGDQEPAAERALSGEVVQACASGGTAATLLTLPDENQFGSFAGYGDSRSALTLATVELVRSSGRAVRVA